MTYDPIEPPAPGLPSDRAFSDDFHRLREAALGWIEPYYDYEHLCRAADWSLAIDPEAAEPLYIAVLTHDMERSVPGGPKLDRTRDPWDDPEYNRLHCERSVEVVSAWLREHDAPERFLEGVILPIREHEFGGSAEGDVAQASDSLSWLEVNPQLAARWVQTGDCDLPKAEAKLTFMFERIRLDRARELAAPMLESALDQLRRDTADGD